jgi:sterol desaturase/sphingolipid hydroxylase (fatty acid hydroxylase superfamily)
MFYKSELEKLLKKEDKKHTTAEVIGVIIGVIIVLALAFGLLCLEAWLAMLLWNWFVVGMLGFANLYMANIWQMWGVMLLCNILFKNRNYNYNNKKN